MATEDYMQDSEEVERVKKESIEKSVLDKAEIDSLAANDVSSSIEEGVYPAKPVQAGRPKGGNPPRHNIMWAQRVGTSNGNTGQVWVNINIKPTGANSTWDYVTSVQDTTLGVNASQPDNVNNVAYLNLIILYYNSVSGGVQNTANKAYAHTRKYNVHYFSGHIEEFEILIPGYRQSVGWLYGAYASTFYTPKEVHPCLTTSPHFQFNVGFNYGNTNSYIATDLYQFTQTDVIDDPSGIWTNGASLVQIPSSSMHMNLIGSIS